MFGKMPRNIGRIISKTRNDLTDPGFGSFPNNNDINNIPKNVSFYAQ
jgi:hypothetical protein